ncbi:MAG: hypothetical protein RL514_654 [Verrucomicrobiota bacterium]|jgi:putative heme-binding domain-containing protein
MKFPACLLVALLLTPLAAAAAAPDARLAALAKLVQDPHPRVRVEAVRALAKIPSAQSAALVLSAVDTIGADSFLDYAVWLSINDLAQPFLAALESGAWVPDSTAKQQQLEFAMKALDPALASASVAKILAAKPLTKDGAGPWIELIGAAGGPEQINRLWEQAAKREFTDAALTRALKSLTSAARLRNVKPAGDGSRAVAFFAYATLPQRVAALELMGAWKNPGAAFAEMVKLAGDERTPSEVRTAAFAAFRELGAIPPVLGALQPLTAATSPAPVRRAAALTLASLQPAKFAGLALTELAETKTEAEALDLWRGVLATKGAAKEFAARVGQAANLPAPAAAAGLRAAREGAQPEPTLVAALTKLANITALSPDKLTPAKLLELAATAVKTGDPARGERVYRRAELGCVLCHSIGGVGGKVGPDMTSLGAAAPVDYLVESVLLPNAKIKEGFHGLTLETKDDLEYNGILVRETGQEIILRNAQNQEVSVAKTNIRKRANAQTSLMPSGLLDTLPESERNDLVAFLARLGKPGDYDASKGGVARVWRVLPVTHRMDQGGWDKITKGDFIAKWTAMESGIGEHTWKPTSSLVNGALVKADFGPASVPVHVTFTSVFVATTFTLAKAGPVALTVDGVTNPEVWVDGQKLAKLANNFPAGPHTVVLRLDGAKLPESVRLKSTDVSWALN